MLFLGIDFGTSGARVIVINDDEEIITQVSLSFSCQNTHYLAQQWEDTLYLLLEKIPIKIRKKIEFIF